MPKKDVNGASRRVFRFGFARSVFESFLRGMASAFDMSGGALMEWRPAKNPWRADARALSGDWSAVGGHLRNASSRE